MKFLSKIHSDVSVPWTSWFKSSYSWSVRKDLGDAHHLDSVIWKDLLSCLPAFRNKTKVTIGSGSMTSFWLDLWFQDSTLAQRFPAIFSHTTKPNASVASVCSSQALEIALFPRLSHAATSELDCLRTLLVSVELDLSVFDVRVSRLDSRTLTTKSAYLANFEHLQEVPFAATTWCNFSMYRCRMFLWLADRGRLFTNLRRFRRGLSVSDACPFCPLPESTEHMFFLCPSVQPFWAAVPALHVDVQACARVRDLWEGAPRCKIKTSVLICALWNLWKRRNSKVFRDIVEPCNVVFRRCADDLFLWTHRCSNQDHKDSIFSWAVLFAQISSLNV
jgi:hypothetical protein